MLWEDPDGRPKDDLNEDQIDKIRWIDTSTMLADPLTKLMKPERLLSASDNSTVDLTPTTQSVIAKLMKQKQNEILVKNSVLARMLKELEDVSNHTSSVENAMKSLELKNKEANRKFGEVRMRLPCLCAA